MSDLLELFGREFPLWHLVVRGTVVYWFLLLVFRFVLRRDVGSLGVADLLFVVLVADAASNAMQGEYKSIGDGLVLVGTLVAWNFGLDWLSYRYEAVARFLEPRPEVLVRHGRWKNSRASCARPGSKRSPTSGSRGWSRTGNSAYSSAMCILRDAPTTPVR